MHSNDKLLEHLSYADMTAYLGTLIATCQVCIGDYLDFFYGVTQIPAEKRVKVGTSWPFVKHVEKKPDEIV